MFYCEKRNEKNDDSFTSYLDTFYSTRFYDDFKTKSLLHGLKNIWVGLFYKPEDTHRKRFTLYIVSEVT